MTSGQNGRSKEGVPTWDGSANTFQAYEEQVLVWEQGIKYENRYLCGPRLAGELTGAAQRMIVGKPPTWVSFNGGVSVFLQHLRQSLGKPQIPEATEFLNKYFRNSRRRVGEGINDYITRKTETYWRACQALKRVMPRTRPPPASQASWAETPYGAGSAWNSRRSSWASTTSNPDDEAQGETEAEDHQDGNETEATWTWSSTSWSSWDWYNQSYWNSYPSSYSGSWKWNSGSPAASMEKEVGILPEFVQAWYLLADAGLTSYERNLIHTAVGGEYTIARVSHELRTQHGENDYRRKEQGNHAYLGEEIEEEPEDEHEAATIDYDLNDHLNEEGSALWSEGQQEIEKACAVLREARRTLRVAREKQHQVKMARKYYQPRDPGSSGRPRDDSAMTCLKCGCIGHRARNCPTQDKTKPESSAPKQTAPFVCYAQSSEDALAAGPTTQEAVAAGCCVVDGGATKTLGSVAALEKIFQRNLEKHGENRVKSVDVSDRPVFGFGNSSEGQCISTINLGVKANKKDGSITVHALDEGEGPVLFSIDALRKLDALIDFRRDLAVFRELDPCKVISLKRSQTGHQLLDLTEDFFANARGTTKPVPSLDEFL